MEHDFAQSNTVNPDTQLRDSKGVSRSDFAQLGFFSAARVYWGIVFTQLVVILMTIGVFFFALTIGIFQLGLITTFMFPHPADQLVSNTLEIALYLGWFVMLAPIVNPEPMPGLRLTRLLLRICLLILTTAAFYGYLPIFGQLRPTLDTIDGVLQLLTIVPTIVLYPLQMLYIAHLAAILDDTKLRRSARLWMWLAPSLFVFSVLLTYAAHEAFFWLMLIVLLIAVIQYWNTLNRLRLALKQRVRAQDQSVQS